MTLSITTTVALIRLVMLGAWGFYALFEKDNGKRLLALGLCLALGNVVAILAAELLEVQGG